MKYENEKPIAAKVNASFRCSAQVKQELINQARLAGLEPSQYYEMLLINALRDKGEIRRLKSELAKAESNLSVMAMKHTNEKNSLVNELTIIRKENESLQNQVVTLTNENSVLHTPHLLQILAEAKGETYTVEKSDGSTLPIRCDSPSDLALVMIYSFDYKK